jgi:hypothetical protein
LLAFGNNFKENHMRNLLSISTLAVFLTGFSVYAGDVSLNPATIDKAMAEALRQPSDTQARASMTRSPGIQTYTGLQATLVAVGYPEPFIPCFSCANGGGGYDVSLPIPQSAITAGTLVDIVVMMNSDTYTGSCVTAYAILDSSNQIVSVGKYGWGPQGGCTPLFSYMVSFQLSLNLPPGDYLVVGGAIGTVGETTRSIRLHIN